MEIPVLNTDVANYIHTHKHYVGRTKIHVFRRYYNQVVITEGIKLMKSTVQIDHKHKCELP